MKITLAQLNFHIGHYEANYTKMADAIHQAKLEGSDLICFSELATCGYPPRDFLEFDDFIALSEEVVDKLRALSHDIAIVVGSPTINPSPEGKDLYNAAFFLHEGEVKHVQHKALLPTYDVFDEYRYFEPGITFDIVEYKGQRIAITICEDIWNIGNENPLYTVCPLDEMQKHHPDLVLNLSASPFSYRKAKERIGILKENVARYGLPIFYANHVGAQTELIFDGGSLVASPSGNIYDEMPYFQECIRTYNIEDVKNSKREIEREQSKEKTALIYQALVQGVRDYFGKLGFRTAILGLSGGIDSAVTAAIASDALGAENVHVVMMPSQFSSDHSISDSDQLVTNYGMIPYQIPIERIFQEFLTSLNPIFGDLPFNITEENLQARTRGVLLMALSNKYGHILLNTSNKSEAAVGYGTLYGDMCGGLAVIGDLYKTEVYALAEYINRNQERIPTNILTKAPSAELRPNQKDSDSLPDYAVLDKVLFEYIENRKSPQDIIEFGFEKNLVRKILRLVNINEFKRYQTPPILRVSTKAFGMGRRMPIVGKYLS